MYRFMSNCSSWKTAQLIGFVRCLVRFGLSDENLARIAYQKGMIVPVFNTVGPGRDGYLWPSVWIGVLMFSGMPKLAREVAYSFGLYHTAFMLAVREAKGDPVKFT